MRILMWHGWLLEGSGSNVYTARIGEAYRRQGHDVLLLCQERHPDRLGFVDAAGTVDAEAVSELEPLGGSPADGRLTLLRPEIGPLLPVFVVDEYEGFERVVAFPDLTEEELGAYLDANVRALRTAARWFEPNACIVGHAVPGAVVAARALEDGAYAAKIHGSDIEYAVRLQDRYRRLAAEGLESACSVIGATRDVLARTIEQVPSIVDHVRTIPPGVDVERFRPMPREQALELAAVLLEANPLTVRGRPSAVDRSVEFALAERDAPAIDDLALRYDQTVPDPEASARLRELAAFRGPLVGYLGKLIPQKGVELLLQALALEPQEVQALIVGFGQHREWLTALTLSLHHGARTARAVRWLAEASPLRIELDALAEPEEGFAGEGLADRVTFTGRLDHRYAPAALAAMDVLVVPSVLDEAFGMVAAEGAAAGALPLVARHSGLAEIAEALEGEVGRPGLFSFQPGPGASRRISEGLDGLLGIPAEERTRLRLAVSAFVSREWTWERTAERLLEAARPGPQPRESTARGPAHA